ncbi:MAG: type II toxin-antitoxin system Phd/YefM family antitoxin [bacterium]
MKTIALADMKDNLSHYLREAGKEQIVITKHGRPAGVLIGFGTEDDWFDYRLENDSRFLKKIERARADIRAGKGVPWEDVKAEDRRRTSASAIAPHPRRVSRR